MDNLRQFFEKMSCLTFSTSSMTGESTGNVDEYGEVPIVSLFLRGPESANPRDLP
jgi:hypothetical protein